MRHESWEQGKCLTDTLVLATNGGRKVVAEFPGYKYERSARRDRVLKCINACRGIIHPDQTVPALIDLALAARIGNTEYDELSKLAGNVLRDIEPSKPEPKPPGVRPSDWRVVEYALALLKSNAADACEDLELTEEEIENACADLAARLRNQLQ